MDTWKNYWLCSSAALKSAYENKTKGAVKRWVAREQARWGQEAGSGGLSRPGCQPGLWGKSDRSPLVQAKSKGEVAALGITLQLANSQKGLTASGR